DLAAREELAIEERPFSVKEALAAREAFITAASTLVMPVVRIDGSPVADGAPGRVATELRARFHEIAEAAPLWSGPERPDPTHAPENAAPRKSRVTASTTPGKLA